VIDYLSTHRVKPSVEIDTFLRFHDHGSLHGGITGFELLRRPPIHLKDLLQFFPDMPIQGLDETTLLAIEVKVKFEGYIEKEIKQAQDFARYENVNIPNNIDYLSLVGMAMEARQKLAKIQPRTIGQASRISGVNPTDISLLVMQLKKRDSDGSRPA
jgi:tRNA uridine 5-carboxymethylaminomethyl modification enzyme